MATTLVIAKEMTPMQRKLTDYWDLYKDTDQVTLERWIDQEQHN